jgi:hypothetical protein
MPRVEFEHTTPVFERMKTVHALDRAAAMIGAPVLDEAYDDWLMRADLIARFFDRRFVTRISIPWAFL